MVAAGASGGRGDGAAHRVAVLGRVVADPEPCPRATDAGSCWPCCPPTRSATGCTPLPRAATRAASRLTGPSRTGTCIPATGRTRTTPPRRSWPHTSTTTTPWRTPAPSPDCPRPTAVPWSDPRVGGTAASRLLGSLTPPDVTLLEVPAHGAALVLRQPGVVREFQNGTTALAQWSVSGGRAACLAEAVVAVVLGCRRHRLFRTSGQDGGRVPATCSPMNRPCPTPRWSRAGGNRLSPSARPDGPPHPAIGTAWPET